MESHIDNDLELLFFEIMFLFVSYEIMTYGTLAEVNIIDNVQLSFISDIKKAYLVL